MSRQAALITGAAKRIGREMALSLARDGYDIAIHYHHSRGEAESLAREVQGLGVQCALFSKNLSETNYVEDLLIQAHESFPHLNLLINNASVFKKSAFLTNTPEEFSRDFHVHVQSPLILTQTFAKLVKKGKIINIVDSAISKNNTPYFSYLLAKKSLNDLTQFTARELGPDILVNAIAPGFILPPEGKELGSERLQSIPLRRQGSIEHILQAMHFILHHDFLTGQTLFVDGGEHLI